jgi:hypothetical protein
MVGFPSREKHGEARHQRCEDAGSGRAKTHSSILAKACERAVEGVYAMVKELAEAARCPSPSSLLPINVIHCRVRPQAECEAVI